jgi:hypothetical protein
VKQLLFAVYVLTVSVASASAGEGVTYTRDVAPILWKHCAGCHHPGEVGPFSLLTYKDAAKRSEFLREITASRRMPPWKAEPEIGQFLGERRLTDDQIKIIARWAEAGAPEGDPRDLPLQPRFPEGWQLGKPDLVLKMPVPFIVPGGGRDQFRCFVIPIPLDSDKTVAAVEFRPGNRKVVHHASFYLDGRRQARKKDGVDGKPGYTSAVGPGIAPTGHLGGWTLGAVPRFLPEPIGMPVAKGSDLVLQLHYHPSGKDESDQSVLGLYFTKQPATKFVANLTVGNDDFNIPAGAKRYQVTAQSQPLPVDTRVLSVSPHMHNLGREMKVTAVLPDGAKVPMVWLKDWDFNWHEVYRFATPIGLPKGSTVRLEAYFDNSADNPKNPHRPPRDVHWGTQLSDEMCLCSVEAIADSVADLRRLEGMRAKSAGSNAVKR